MTNLTTYEVQQMRAALLAGCRDGYAGIAPRRASDFAGQPARNFRNYLDGYKHGAMDRAEEARNPLCFA